METNVISTYNREQPDSDSSQSDEETEFGCTCAPCLTEQKASQSVSLLSIVIVT